MVFFVPAGVLFSDACQAQLSIKIYFFTDCLRPSSPPPKKKKVWMLPFLKTQHLRDKVKYLMGVTTVKEDADRLLI